MKQSNYKEIKKHIANMESFKGNTLEGIFSDYGDGKHYSVWSYGHMEILYVEIKEREALVWFNRRYASVTTSKQQNLTFKAFEPILEELKGRRGGFTLTVKDRPRKGANTDTVFRDGMPVEELIR